MPSDEKSGGGGERILPVSSSPLSQASNTPSQASFKSYSPLLNPTSPNHSRPFRRHCLGFIKTLLWTVSLIILTIIFVSRPAILPHSHSRSHPRPTKVATAASNLTLTQYIDSHFPRDLPESQTPHLWITLADHEFAATGTANLDIFFKQLNVERKDYYARKRRDVRDSVIVTICLDEGCVKECFERDMYCYEGFESRRPPEILPATWPKLASLIELLPNRDVFFIDADVAIRQDPYPALEPLMERFDLLAQENWAFEHFNTGFLWMKSGPVIADSWNRVLEMDMQETSRDQFNLNTVLGTSQARLEAAAQETNGLPLASNFTTLNGLRVHVVNQRLFRVSHLMEALPVYERHDALLHHNTCNDDKALKLYLAKVEGYWNDVDNYYTQPPRLLSIEHLSATQAQITQLFKIVLAAAHYTGRSVVPPEFTTIIDLADSPFSARRSLSTFPLANLEEAFDVPILEPNYVSNAQSHLLGRSVLNVRQERQDHEWKTMRAEERSSRLSKAIALTQTSDIDLRKYLSFRSLVERMKKIDLAQTPHIRFVDIDRDEIPSWLSWDLSALPVGKLTTCEELNLPWQCGEFCRGAEELRKGRVEGNWTPLEATRFRHARRFA